MGQNKSTQIACREVGISEQNFYLVLSKPINGVNKPLDFFRKGSVSAGITLGRLAFLDPFPAGCMAIAGFWW